MELERKADSFSGLGLERSSSQVKEGRSMRRIIGSQQVMRRFSFVVVLPFLLACDNPSRASSAEYSFSRSPDKVVLQIDRRGPMTGFAESYTVFGDGRLERLVSRPADNQTPHTSAVRITDQELDGLVGLAVEYELPQWDDIRAESLRRRRDGGDAMMHDAVSTSVSLNLTLFRTEAIENTDLKTTISVAALDAAAERYSDIPQFEGMRLLLERTQRLWHDRRGSAP